MCFYYLNYGGNVVAILQNNFKEIASHSFYTGGHIGERGIGPNDYPEFERFVQECTGKKIKWGWDDFEQVDYPYLEGEDDV